MQSRGSSGGPSPLGKALAELIALRGFARTGARNELKTAWQSVAGERISARTRVLSLNRGVLQVGVFNSAMLGELTSFHRTELLDTLREKHAGLKIRDLKFRLRADLAEGS
ncbi:MAG: DUF721 domain-containing protein [Planctomycetaceae bacterium]|nr:DUF721 domain-containing protein [Planctomycetaceae bacterium]